MALAISSSAFAASVTVTGANVDGVQGSANQTQYGLGVKGDFNKNLAGDVSFLNVQTNGTNALSTRLEAGLTAQNTYGMFTPYARVALGEKYTNTTNFTYYVNGRDSITYYGAVKGDANNTGFKMARLTPIKIINPANAKKYIIDETVQYDDVINEIEVNMPGVKVDEGNLVNIPVKVLTGGQSLGALQLDLKYDTSLLEFKTIQNSEKMFKWTTYMNPSNGVISWGGADLTNTNMLTDGEQAFTIQFVAKKPQDQWGSAALWTGAKYVGDASSSDMNIRPTNGVVEVRRVVKSPVSLDELNKVIVFPNPTDGVVQFEFKIKEEGPVKVDVRDLVGREVSKIIEQQMPSGTYRYVTDLSKLENGYYLLTITSQTQQNHAKIIVSK